MSDLATSSPGDEPRRSRATAIGAVAFTLLALPFLVLGLWLLNLKALVELDCPPSGPCTLTRAGWLTREEVGRFPLSEVTGVDVERTRSARRGAEPIFRPKLETARGAFPLFYQWTKVESEATEVAERVRRYLAAPGDAGLSLAHDDRRASLRVGGAFTVVGVLSLLFSFWLALRTRTHRRAERAARG